MPELEVLTNDPGREVRTSKGSRMIVIRDVQQSVQSGTGLDVLGVFCSMVNDLGQPNVPRLLGDIQEVFGKWGGFSPYVGDGAATGYNGNGAWMLWKLPARYVVVCPVDMASKKTGTALKLKITRTFKLTGEADTEVLTTDRPHGLKVGDVVTTTGIVGGASATWTGDKTVATVPSTTTLTLTGVAFSTDVTDGVLTPAVLNAYGIKAGTIVKTAGDYHVRTLEDLSWANNTAGEKEVRFAYVSGTKAAINTLVTFLDTTVNARLTTTSTDEADAMDSTEITARYTAAMAAMNVNPDGKSARLVITDRSDTNVCDALSLHCDESTARGILRIAVITPPVGTTPENARATSGVGVARSTLSKTRTAYCHGGFTRRGDALDRANLSVVNDYNVTFPGQALLAAKMTHVVPEENPTFVETDPFVPYGVNGLEQELSVTQAQAHFAAHICAATMEPLRGSYVGAYRDGVMADGTEIATRRLEDLVTLIAVDRATPWHKRLAAPRNRQSLFDSVEAGLAKLVNPTSKTEDKRVERIVMTLTYDPEVREATLIITVYEYGSMNVITIRIAITPAGFSVLGEEV